MLEQGKQYSASDFIELKSKVKAEMLRRCYTGSLKEYGSTTYDFSTKPQTGGQILTEQANKIIEPMNAINDSGFAPQNIGDPAKAMDQLYAKILTYSSAPLAGSGHYCNASCSGLCSTACSATCSGECTGECGGNCTTSCGNSCTGSCTGSCSGSCSGGCGGDCTGSGCQGYCSGSCGGCGQYCSGSCVGGCSTSCVGGCYNGCSGGCQGSATGPR